MVLPTNLYDELDEEAHHSDEEEDDDEAEPEMRKEEVFAPRSSRCLLIRSKKKSPGKRNAAIDMGQLAKMNKRQVR